MQGSGSPTRAMEAVVRPTRSREGVLSPWAEAHHPQHSAWYAADEK